MRCSPKELPSQEYLLQCFTYEPETGKLFWKDRPRHHFDNDRAWMSFHGNFSNKECGSKAFKQDGRPLGLTVRMGKSLMLVHRIIIVMVEGFLSTDRLVDHKDGNPFNNVYSNLRPCDYLQNVRNMKRRREGKKSSGLPKGVSRNRDKFRASVRHLGKFTSLGTFVTPHEAHQAYCSFVKDNWGEFARTE